MVFRYPFTIEHIFISPGHNYFRNPRGRPGNHPTIDVDQADAIASAGLQGDRFCRYREHFDGHVTFFSMEVFELMEAALGSLHAGVIATRRNIITRGLPLNQLIGRTFSVGSVQFKGTRNCAPCQWMDTAFGEGGWSFLKGRGGLRAQILTGGSLVKGANHLDVERDLERTTITARIPTPSLP